MKKLVFVFLLFVFLFIPIISSADIIDPNYQSAECKPNETMVTCSIPGFAPNANQNVTDCDKYKNSNYYLLDSEGHSYGGQAKYCQVSNNHFVRYGYYFVLFVLTFLLEMLVLIIFGYRDWRSFFVILIANLISVPLLQYALSHINPGGLAYAFGSRWVIVVLEAGVILAESVIITLTGKKYGFFKTLLFVAIANIVSALLGTFIIGLLY